MPEEPVDYVIGKIIGNSDDLTEEELELISGGVVVTVPCPSSLVVCPHEYRCCQSPNVCHPC
jgi:hypothetical protein